ncbi:MAG TPA: BON domain-containing protein [Burkholderiales bacterium]|nr:BON domain-containing protein [Burkholderiales bacterium]
MRHLTFVILVVSVPMLHGCVALVAGTAAGGGVVVAEDRRSNAAMLDDEGIELKAQSRISEKFKQYSDTIHVNVTSYNRIVLLTGEVPSEEVRSGIENLVKDIPNVRNVVDELVIAEPTSFSSRTDDTLITSKVKTRIIEAKKFQPNWVKVVTENKVVYLMGIVNHTEASAAAEIASTTSGVDKVVKVFEYTDDANAKSS